MSIILPLNKITYSDCLKGMKSLPDNCADCCVTDPPYGWKFMGKKWDYEIPAVEIWQEVYRVLKPGAHILVACGTRTQHRMVVNIEDAGFEIRDVISWHYGSGFPKSLDISKAIDKAAGSEREVIGINERLAARSPRPRKATGQDRNFGEDNRKGDDFKLTFPSTEAAKQWDGWGTALKPATEFWTLARKPLSENTIAANVIKHGTGGLNIDACRIPFRDPKDKESAVWGTGHNILGGNYAGGNGKSDGSRKNIEANDSGRFPANVILDEFMAAEMDTATRGGASRFFYVAKPSPEERGNTTHPTVKPQTLIQYLIKLICPIESGRIVLDPFAGSGSHCIAARKLGVDFIAYEIEEHSCNEANDRLEKELGLFH